MGACSDHDPELGHTGSGGLAGSGAAGGAAGVTGGAAGAEVDAGSDAGDPCAPPPTIQNPVFPCEIDAILEAKCRRCHSSPPQNTAPFPLVKWENTRIDYVGKPVYVRMEQVVESGFMPLVTLPLDPPVEPLTADEKSTLLAWLQACAQPEDGVVCQ